MPSAEESPRWSNPEAYEASMGRWSRPAARAFLIWLAPPEAARWIDVGRGTGALTHAILTTTDPSDATGRTRPREQKRSRNVFDLGLRPFEHVAAGLRVSIRHHGELNRDHRDELPAGGAKLVELTGRCVANLHDEARVFPHLHHALLGLLSRSPFSQE